MEETPWPLLVVVTNETPEGRYTADEDIEAVFRALVVQAGNIALKELRETRRVGEVRMLKLQCHNEKED
jgi:hypothetical protein